MTREEFKQKNGIIGKSNELNDLVDVVIQVAPSDITVLIYGESGVGKEIALGDGSIRVDTQDFAAQIKGVTCGSLGVIQCAPGAFVRGGKTVAHMGVGIVPGRNQQSPVW